MESDVGYLEVNAVLNGEPVELLGELEYVNCRIEENG